MKQIIKKYKYKENIDLEYISTLGWVFLPKGEKMCTVCYFTDDKTGKEQAIKLYERG